MKRFLIVLLVLLIANSAFALRQQTLIKERTHIGWYIAPVVKFGDVNDEFSVLGGLRGGVILDHFFFVGLAGYGLADGVDEWDNHNYHHDYGWYLDSDRLDFGYGGLELGFISDTRKLAHVSGYVLIGAGGVEYNDNYWRIVDFNFVDLRYDWEPDAVFVVEPSLDLEVNVTPSFRIGLGGSYRFVNDVEHPLFDDDDLSGPTFNVVFKFGSF